MRSDHNLNLGTDDRNGNVGLDAKEVRGLEQTELAEEVHLDAKKEPTTGD